MRTRFVIILLTTVITPSIGFAQNSVDSTNVNKDSLCQNECKTHSDTAKVAAYFRFQSFSPTIYSRQQNQKVSVNQNLFKQPKYDFFREKFMNLQIANTIRSHISK